MFSCIVIGVLSSVNFTITKKNTIEIIEEFDIANLKQIESSIENMHVISKSVANSLFTDNYIQKLIIDDPYTIETSSIFDTINSRIYPYPLIHSVYLYDGRKDLFFVFGSSNRIRSAEEFHDSAIVQYLSNFEDYKTIEPIPRKIPNIYGVKDDLIDVYSYILLEKDFKTESIDKSVIINIYTDKLVELFSSLSTQNKEHFSEVFILNREGMVITSEEPFLYLDDISDTPFFKTINSVNDMQGVLRTEWEGKKMIVSYIKMVEPDWYIISLKPINSFLNNVIILRNWILIITVIVALIVFITSYFTARRIVSPLEKLRSVVHPFQSSDENIRITFLNSFNWFFDLSIKEYERLYSFENNYRDSAKNEVLLNLLSGRLKTSDFNTVKIPALQLSVEPEASSLIFMISIDNEGSFQKTFSQSEQNSVLNSILRITKDTINSTLICEITRINDLGIAGIVNVASEQKGLLINLIKDVQNKVKKQFAVTITVSLSDIFIGVDKIADQFINSETFIQYRMLTGYESIITSEINSGKLEKFDLFDKIDNICSNMKIGRTNEQMESFSSFFKQVQLYTADQIYFGMTIMYIKVYDELRKMAESGYFNFGISDYRDLNERFASWELLSEVEKDIKTIFRQIDNARQDSYSKKDNELAKSIREFLENNISDFNLSLKSTADHFGYSSDYLGKLFKRVNLFSVSEYIKNIRLEKACILLAETNMNIEIIIEAIGWQNAKYFYTIFKSIYGISPTQFRRKSRK